MCDVVAQSWMKIVKWLDMSFPHFSCVADLLAWIDSANMVALRTRIIKVIVLTTIWMLWRYRNNAVFRSNARI